jgi:hypothetical protein
MISANSNFVLRHKNGRYLIRRLHIPTYPGRGGCHIPGEPSRWIYSLTPNPLDADMARNVPALMQMIAEHYWNRDEWSAVDAPVCACCGSPWVERREGGSSPYRCQKHRHWNPCVVEGCKRVRVAPVSADGRAYLANNQVICSEHWRRYVPPRSPLRRAYHRFWRIAKRQATPENPHGWTVGLNRRFERFWRGLVAQVRRKSTEGYIDVSEIERMFGGE